MFCVPAPETGCLPQSKGRRELGCLCCYGVSPGCGCCWRQSVDQPCQYPPCACVCVHLFVCISGIGAQLHLWSNLQRGKWLLYFPAWAEIVNTGIGPSSWAEAVTGWRRWQCLTCLNHLHQIWLVSGTDTSFPGDTMTKQTNIGCSHVIPSPPPPLLPSPNCFKLKHSVSVRRLRLGRRTGSKKKKIFLNQKTLQFSQWRMTHVYMSVT